MHFALSKVGHDTWGTVRAGEPTALCGHNKPCTPSLLPPSSPLLSFAFDTGLHAMPLRIAEDAPLPERSSSKSMTDSERKASGTRSGDIERLWHRPFLAKARKQRLGDPLASRKGPRTPPPLKWFRGSEGEENPLEEIPWARERCGFPAAAVFAAALRSEVD